MAKITVEFGEPVVEIEGVEHLWALHCQLAFPLAHGIGPGIRTLALVCAREEVPMDLFSSLNSAILSSST